MSVAGGKRILLVEDDLDIAAGIGDYLQAQGLQVDFAGSAREALARSRASGFDLFVLDVGLPGRDGFSLCRELRQGQGLATPVIFLTAHCALEDKLAGFDAGAVDYMVKPFEPAELLARIRVVLAHAPARSAATLEVGGYRLDLHGGLLSRDGRRLQLHAAGLVILRRLMQAHPRSVDAQALVEELWGDQAPPSNPLRAHVYQLRQALRDCFGEAPIHTVRGIGYRFGDGQ